jgi:hypothetical protein
MRSWRREGSGVLKVIISRGSGGRGYSGAAASIRHVFSAFQLILRIMRAGERGRYADAEPGTSGAKPCLPD